MDINTDYIDCNYVWQRRIQAVFKNHKTAVPFPYAAVIGVEFNPAFERQEKINVELLTNGAILDIDTFLKSVTETASFHLLDILIFNFDLGLDVEHPICSTYASRVYSSAKGFEDQFKTRPLQLHAKLQDFFPLPDTVENTDVSLQNPEMEIPFDLQLNDERKGDPVLINDISGQMVQLSMDYYPLCKRAGVFFVLRPSNASAQKLSTTLLTGGIVLEMLDFCRILSGSFPQMLKEIILHNFGDIYELSYLSDQVKVLTEKSLNQPTRELRESLCKQSFKCMLRKVNRLENIKKRACVLDADVESVPEKRRAEMELSNTDNVLQDEEINEASYMCPVEFEPEFQPNVEQESERDEQVSPMRENEEEEEEEDYDYVPPKTMSRKTPRMSHYVSKYIRKGVNTPTVPISRIFCEDTLPIHLKTVKQKEWTRRTNRIKEIFNKEVRDLFCRCSEIGLDFNVGSGRKQNLDMNLLTGHTLYEVNRFSLYLSKSVSAFLMGIIEGNFNICIHDEMHKRKFMSYLLGKEKSLCNQGHDETFMSTPIIFPEGYNAVDFTREDEIKRQSGRVVGEDIPDEFPYCKDMNMNLWSLDGRPPDAKLDLATMTHGSLLEMITFVRRLASNSRDLLNDVLEHNFDVDLQDPATEDAQGLNKWIGANKQLLKKPFSLLKTNLWLVEEVSLKHYSLPKPPQSILETVAHVPVRKVQEYTYTICKEIGLDLHVTRKSPSKQKLDMHLLTRGVLFEVHNFVKTKCNRYVPALYEILDYNFDLSSQRHRKVELAWSIAAQVLAMVRKGARRGQYMQQVFELPFETQAEELCKQEPEEGADEEAEPSGDDVVFVHKLIPVDIAVEIE